MEESWWSDGYTARCSQSYSLNADDWQKRYISMQCGNDVEKIKEVEKCMANIVNGVVNTLKNSGVDYLNKIV